jgi:hypothetical protein
VTPRILKTEGQKLKHTNQFSDLKVSSFDSSSPHIKIKIQTTSLIENLACLRGTESKKKGKLSTVRESESSRSAESLTPIN